jgi:hypothetical protein
VSSVRVSAFWWFWKSVIVFMQFCVVAKVAMSTCRFSHIFWLQTEHESKFLATEEAGFDRFWLLKISKST